ncbi:MULTISPECIES: nucleoside diphosphate kinase regulator [Cupriavidus]|uniref:Nucleoside diphosphate kinase regulator n=1 Tax=Cupriavidus pauculus TaxID=82633 RepID=A0A5P2H9K7_9BURK|nr:nucleoside diphosphate kinase regulator [Cupriavidus pauculus]QET04666.1 nucleoside diphosphate kinase regulator [Cupriavidus pauculus]
MSTTQQHTPTLFLTELDVVRLERLAARSAAPHLLEMLDDVLARAAIVAPSEIPHDIVTMNTRFVCLLEGDATPREWTLVYPDAADYEAGRVSVLSPAGGALLGVHAGSTVQFPLPDGRAQRIVVTEILYQPEANGEYTV